MGCHHTPVQAFRVRAGKAESRDGPFEGLLALTRSTSLPEQGLVADAEEKAPSGLGGLDPDDQDSDLEQRIAAPRSLMDVPARSRSNTPRPNKELLLSAEAVR